eukprot:Sspe_Gene.56379::Locus_31021_Transcript_1_1_Confidence_1.000_Length_2502::g.56379::m.56379
MDDNAYTTALLESLGPDPPPKPHPGEHSPKWVRVTSTSSTPAVQPDQVEDTQRVPDAAPCSGYGDYTLFSAPAEKTDSSPLAEAQEQLSRLADDVVSNGVGTGTAVVSVGDAQRASLSPSEEAYCASAPDPSASRAGRMAAKLAVVKALSSLKQWDGPSSAIEVVPSSTSAPVVLLGSEATAAAAERNVKEVKVSISHSGDRAIAVAACVMYS